MMNDVASNDFAAKLAERGIRLSERQSAQFERYYQILAEWNDKMNLTAITERDQVYIKHFYDSVSLSFFVDMDKVRTIADIGSGAGFPSIPLKIAFPHLQVTIVDSLNKRIQFLTHLAEQLELSDVACLHGRAEDMGRDASLRDKFDLTTARAVARLNVLCELCLPFVKPGGTFAAMKGMHGQEELAEAGTAIRLLQARHRETHSMQLPMEESRRAIIVIEKTGPTPGKYPRKAGVPGKQPLV